MAVFVALCIHEIGHIIAAIILKIKYERVKITLLGFNLNAHTDNVPTLNKIILFFAGPMFNIVCYLIFLDSRYIEFAEMNLFLSLMNLFPIVPLDGGNICKSILQSRVGYISTCRYIIMTNTFFIICFVIIIYISKNYLFLLLILMALNGIVKENDIMVEKRIRHSYKSLSRKSKFY